MATKNGDSVAADAAFTRVGENYDIEKWITEEYFNQMKTWASEFAPFEARSRKIKGEAEANALSPEWATEKCRASPGAESRCRPEPLRHILGLATAR